MADVAVLTDSIACLPPELAREYSIEVIPWWIIVGDRQLRDEMDITADRLLELRRQDVALSTSQPSIGDFVDVYRRLAGQVEAVVYVHLAGAVTGVYNAARQAEVAQLSVRTVDSRALVMSQGFVALEAGRAAQAGASLEEVAARAEALRPRVRLLLSLETLTTGMRAMLPGLADHDQVLRTRPIVALSDGRLEVVRWVRTGKQALEVLLNRMSEEVGDQPVHAAVLHAGARHQAEDLRSQVGLRFDCRQVHLGEFSAGATSRMGPEALGLAFYAEGPHPGE